MRLFSTILTLAFLGLPLTAHADATVKGAWLRGDGVARVIVADCGTALCLKNTWIAPGSTEKVGEYLILRVKQVGENLWKGRGTYADHDVHFSAEMKVEGDEMTTNGCVAGLFCKTTRWTRIK
jgi:uncharacterized protein (DUF2147 family)